MYGSFGVMLQMAYAGHLCMKVKLIIILVYFTIGIILFSFVYYDYKKKQENDEQQKKVCVELNGAEFGSQ